MAIARKTLFLALLVSTAAMGEQIAIVGDSSATGAVANPALAATWAFVGDLLLGPPAIDLRMYAHPQEFSLPEQLNPLRRVYSSPEEEVSWQAWLDRRVDASELSWAYLVGTKLGVAPPDILLAAQDGRRIETISTQLSRIAGARDSGDLPPKVFIVYSANDICSEEVFSRSVTEFEDTYREQLDRQLTGLQQNFRSAPDGTSVYLLAPLPFAKIFTTPSVLDKKIPFYGGEDVTCRDLREHQVHRQLLGQMDVAQKINSLCPSILSDTDLNDSARVLKIAKFYQAMVQAQEQVLRQRPRVINGFEFVAIPEIQNIDFSGEDIANDCFHPSERGHEAIARVVLRNL